LNCKDNEVFCFVDMPCEQVAQKIKPIGFVLSGYVYELPPQEYLFVSSPSKCFLKVHKCNLPGENQNIFLMGDLLLRHFYSAFDFDKNQIGLGLNKHSEDRGIAMYKQGKKPKNKK